MSVSRKAILWFRQDLRLRDNPALIRAIEDGAEIIPVYILDDQEAADWRMGAASRWWLHHSLKALNNVLDGHFIFRRGRARDIIPELIRETKAEAVYWNRCYEPWRTTCDTALKEELRAGDIKAESFNASLLWEPWETLKSDGTHYKVFTPFYRACLARPAPAQPQNKPRTIPLADVNAPTLPLDGLELLPRIGWHLKMEEHWQPGEDGAQERLRIFLESGLAGYKDGRDRPDREFVSRLSPHLHFGEISVREVWHAALRTGAAEGREADAAKFCSELGWREFSAQLLYHFPALPEKPMQEKFARFQWTRDPDALRRWQKGLTGIPIIDAGMRELWETGWMHNRVRMIAASFLVKNMGLHWDEGQRWFWDCLVDADLANNAASWQWVAGCGADAAPFFRIFNPVTQGEKFDPDGNYVRRFVPELRDVPAEYIHRPWEYQQVIKDYPEPMLDLAQSRAKALEAYSQIK